MTATNHALTGAVIGLIIHEPILALPLALTSHFICDALPHFGEQQTNNRKIASGRFRNYLMLDALLCFALVVALAIFQPANWQLAAVCAFVATSPDLLWINRYINALKRKKWHPNIYSKFAAGIQWFQRPVGWVVEAAWFVAAIVIIMPFLRAG